MHDAYELIQLLKLSQQHIDSIAAYDDNLLVGTRQGYLLMYGIVCREGDQKHEVELLRYSKTFSKKPIQQLAVIPEYQLLVSLSDNLISVHDMTIYNFPVVTQVQRSRGAVLFVLDIKRFKSLTGESSVTVRMCVAVKRKLQMYYWKNGKFLDMCEDFTIADVPKALAWCDETIVVGFKGDYCLVQLTGTIQDLFPTGKQDPIISKLTNNTYALGKDSQSILMNTKGNPTHKYAIKWSENPVDVAYDDPYLIAILMDCVEIRTIEPQMFVQTLAVPKPRLVCRCERQGRLYVASATHVWCLQAVPFDRQIHMLLQERQFQLALKLTNISNESDEEKKKNVREIQKLYAFHLFNNKQFKDSMKEFLELEIDPYEVIRLFPDLLPQQSRNAQDTAHSRPKLQDRELENGLLALIEFLTEVRHKLMKDVKNHNCNNANNIQDKTTQQLLQIIDTTLLKCYLQTNDALVAPLLRLNHCHLHETEKTLKKYQKYSELIILYQTKGLHQKALELLQKQADQPDSILHGYERTLQYLQHLGKENINVIFEFAGWILESHPEEGLKIFTEDIMEVEQLPRPKVLDYLLRTHKNLVIPYLEHVVNVWKDTNPIFHNALVHQYQERSQKLLAPTATPLEHEEGQKLRVKLLNFLENSSHYTPETVLVHFPPNCLFEERAIVLGKLGRHEQALLIYVSILGDVQRAIKYCDKVYRQRMEGSDEVYVILMRMLISPPENWLVGAQPPPPPVQPDLETALKLLEEHATKIHPIKALSVLPDKVPLERIKHFLETSLHAKLNERRKTQVLKGLLYAEHLQVQEQRIRHESQSISMTEFNVCPVCKKRFGNQSAFARYPNGDIVHYSCQDRRA